MTSSGAPRHVVLVGLMASGKTTVGRLLAARLGRPFVDNDVALEERTGRSAREIAADDGADALHALEAEALVDALDRPEPAVVAAAAAAATEPQVEAALRRHDVVYLRAAPEVLAARIENNTDDGHRPFVVDDPARVLAGQFEARDARYHELATLIVDAGDNDPERVVDAIVDGLSPAPAR
ncbi:MAG: shikimate kinase [Actinomycetota bacterium]|nr:shikimate kinase [Actinomycetota bacterium]